MKSITTRRTVLRNSIIFPFVLFCVCVAGSCQTSAEERQPSVVLIMADDLGYECIGANGGTSYETPVLDRLAAEGMRFEHGYSQPLCTPSRVQIMTGVYNVRNYVRFGVLDRKETTFANLLRDAGYATCVAGKWQLQGGLEGPGHFGFDEYCLWQLNRRPGRYPNPGLEINGKQVDYTNGEYGPSVVTDYICDLPTMCQAAGVSVPRELKIDGRSFLPQLRGEKGNPRDWIYCWYSRGGQTKKAKIFARNQRYKLFHDGRFLDMTDGYAPKALDLTKLDNDAAEAHRLLQGVLEQYKDARPKKLR